MIRLRRKVDARPPIRVKARAGTDDLLTAKSCFGGLSKFLAHEIIWTMNRLSGGGVAAQAGINYQNRVAAWLAVRILAEQDAPPLWDLSAGSTLEFLRCETEQPVDDVMVGTS